MRRPLLCLTDKGLYCPAGDFYVDPSRGVDHAVVTHAHSDHARRGSRRYYCASSSVGLMKARLGARIQAQGIPFGEKFRLGATTLSLHPAGHILGSAQLRIEHRGEVWVVSGDYKREPDPTCEPFETVPCDVFVTEATFGTPAYAWKRTQAIGEELYAWWQSNRGAGRNSLLLGYSLGKSQRLLGELAPFVKEGHVWIHPTMAQITQCYRDEGISLCPTEVLTDEKLAHERLEGQLILAPPSVENSGWSGTLQPYESAFASGWMNDDRGFRGSERKGFVVSDHADWPDLVRTVQETGARQVYVLHRGSGALVRHLRKLGLEAQPVEALRPKMTPALPDQLPLFC